MLVAELLLEPAEVLRRNLQIGGQHAVGYRLDNLRPILQHGLITLHGRAVDERKLPLADADLGRCQAEHPAGELVRAVDERIEGCTVHPQQCGGYLAGFGHQKGRCVEVKRERRHEYRTGRGKAEGRLLGVVHMEKPHDAALDAEHVGADFPEIDDAAARFDLNLLHRPEKALHKGVGGHELTLFLDQLFQILVHARNINHNLPKMQNLEA